MKNKKSVKEEDVKKGVDNTEEEITETELEKAITELETLAKGKSEENDEEDEEDDEDDEDEDDTEKSFTDDMSEYENIEKAVEVSDFLGDITKAIGESMDTLAKSIKNTEKKNVEILGAMSNAMATIAKSVSELTNRMSEIEKQPTSMKKSVTASAGITRNIGDVTEEISKSKIQTSINQLMMKGRTDLKSDIIAFEATGICSQPLLDAVKEL